MAAVPVQEFKLEPDNELRFETELKGDSVRLEVIYLNTHAVLEQLRRKAEAEEGRGPIVMVVGPADVGKSTLCRMMLNWGVRMGRKPLFVDLDVGQGNISIPGTIGAVMVERPAMPGDGYNLNAPLVYHYGHISPEKNLELLKIVTSKLASFVLQKFETNKRVAHSGMIINTCGWVKGDGYKLLTHAASAFEVDLIVVLDQERLYNELIRDMPNFVKVVFQPKSGGAVERNRQFRISTRESKVRQYFYGPKNTLFPQNVQVNFDDIKVFKIGAPKVSAALLPEGMMPDENSMTRIVPVSPGPDLLHHIMAMSYAESTEEDLLTTNVLGFVCVLNVDTEKQKLTLLSPHPAPLPRNIFLISDVQYMEI
ncbi:protein CLP1 homolog isoform X2 [Artemia franciscana]|uniref:protein CLP1 homolog isoform X2 n=1 Tax=Artemia franciscana TaxID=6661 RepID=UPI0032DB423C